MIFARTVNLVCQAVPGVSIRVLVPDLVAKVQTEKPIRLSCLYDSFEIVITLREVEESGFMATCNRVVRDYCSFVQKRESQS